MFYYSNPLSDLFVNSGTKRKTPESALLLLTILFVDETKNKKKIYMYSISNETLFFLFPKAKHDYNQQ